MLGIFTRENQQTCDEYICFLFEGLNSKGEQRFQKLLQLCRSDAITRENFAKEFLRQEFEAVKETKKVLANIDFTPKEKTESHSYSYFMQAQVNLKHFCPTVICLQMDNP